MTWKLDELSRFQQALLLFGGLAAVWAFGHLSGNADRVAAEAEQRAQAARAAQPPPVDTSQNYLAQSAAVAKFTGMPLVEEASWVDGDFVLVVHKNGSSWQSVADAACSWIRQNGMKGPFGVSIIEAYAAQNKRWNQLARAGCG